MKTIFVITVVASALSVVLCRSSILSEEFIKSINEKATTWTARNNFDNYSTEQLNALVGVIGISRDPEQKLPLMVHTVRDGIPVEFDSRQVWPKCSSIRTIRNQGQCGSCWAFAAVEVMSDRLCIFTDGQKQFTFSPEELVSCCSSCGDCGGGYVIEPFNYWQRTGIPSGGDYGSNLGCRPYTAIDGNTPQCNERCVGGYGKDWNSDIRHGIATFEVTNTIEQIQHEIVINGPVVALMEVYEDFYNYANVKIIGWGVDNGTPYWLIANSWGTGWGEKGYFRILRGSNNSQIESYIVAGNPNTDE
ncbi:hypothetical protein NQ314_016131 [Rhamnusium bicolor]|uniref:Peptidase C1A papain C-terminal domain-containing protein n=1 Tax=Rhamnusium bicolor TaxID=1586634 RepID=A0AAV8WY17_9CUCU|nr:hypothetical protein NQ314_016131 [Rhamnusium bicolor]